MADSPISQTQQIGDFFTVAEQFPVNLEVLADDVEVPDRFDFEQEMPELFKVASNMVGSDQDLLQKLKMDSQHSPVLVTLLEQMNQRMVMMLGYLLRYEDDPQQRYDGIEYGGGGLRVLSNRPFEAGQLFRAKLFFKEESLAVYCYLRCDSCDYDDERQQQILTLAFAQILEQDQEHLIRASLHAQSRQLKRRAQQRQQQSKPTTDDA